MNNVESASAAGDNYNLRNILLADGVGAIVGSVLGSPFPPAVYIGHPGWKAVGGRIGYSLATGVVIGLVCFLGLTALLLAVVPLVAILPILLYIGLVIGAQAFTASPARHAPAVMLAIIPNIAAWTQNQVDGALGAAGTNAGKLGAEALGNNGVIYSGMALLGGGAVLAGLILGRDRRFHHRPRIQQGRDLCACWRRLSRLWFHSRHPAAVDGFASSRSRLRPAGHHLLCRRRARSERRVVGVRRRKQGRAQEQRSPKPAKDIPHFRGSPRRRRLSI